MSISVFVLIRAFVLAELVGWAVTAWVSFRLPAAITSGKVRASPVCIRVMQDIAAACNHNPPVTVIVLLVLWPLFAFLMLAVVVLVARDRWQDRTALRHKQDG